MKCFDILYKYMHKMCKLQIKALIFHHLLDDNQSNSNIRIEVLQQVFRDKITMLWLIELSNISANKNIYIDVASII
jgi:hypothetical protein